MGLLTGKTVVVTGVLTDQSIAFHIARLSQEEGADVILTSFGRTMSLTRRSATRLHTEPPIVELDVTNDDDLAQFADRLGEHCERVDGLVHSIGFAPSQRWGKLSSYVLVGRGYRHAGECILAGVFDHGSQATHDVRRERGGPGLRRLGRVAHLRLDGGRQGCA